MKRFLFLRGFIPLLLLICLLSGAAAGGEGKEGRSAKEAEDITALCTIKPASVRKEFSKCTDGRYKTFWHSNAGKRAAFTVTVPEGQRASGLWLRWYEEPHAVSLQVQDQSGEWVECACTEGVYLSDYIELPAGVTSFRIANKPGNSRRMALSELQIFGEGEQPGYVQKWNPPAEKADLMIIVAHPDDEILWFGGLMPTYAGEQGKSCQVCMMVPAMPWRRLELLDCLWTCGVRNYPVWAKFRDGFSLSMKEQYKTWNKKHVYEVVTGWIRRFKPDVLVTHDLKGEYGHGAHRVCADAVTHCLEHAANPEKYKKSVKEYGTWDVPKCYVHLYGEQVIDLNWQVPLQAFGGKTGFEVAQEAFLCHKSQQAGEYRVVDGGEYDCSLFGLYRSQVGDDELKNDMFEHISTQ